jgi:thymidine phosphorylase
VDPRVGFTALAHIGQTVQAGQVLAVVHAADSSAARRAGERLLSLIPITDGAGAAQAVLIERLEA